MDASRRIWWGEKIRGNYSPTNHVLIHEYLEMFLDQDVLEIGPGTGRQTFTMNAMARTFSIADISNSVLNLFPMFDSYLISDYECDLGHRFDVVAAFYVMHHVCVNELVAFLGFMARHGKTIIFNSAESIEPPFLTSEGICDNDGLTTTLHSMDAIHLACQEVGLCVIDEKEHVRGGGRGYVCERETANVIR